MHANGALAENSWGDGEGEDRPLGGLTPSSIMDEEEMGTEDKTEP